jgi:multicomponent Na+:H+ antiporter subunit D
MTDLAMAGLVFSPLLAAVVLLLARPSWHAAIAALSMILLPPALGSLTLQVAAGNGPQLALGGFAPPLGISWRVDALSIVLLWLNLILFLLVSLQARMRFPFDASSSRPFWPLWLLLMAGINALLLSADLFNLYVTLELVTLAAVGLVTLGGQTQALRAAMRYLLLGLMASLLYLLGVGLIYAQTGSLDLYELGKLLEPGLLSNTALVLMIVGLLVKAAIFPLHIWLPAAHGNAPGPVSALLSAIVVKVAIYIIWRLWFWTAADWTLDPAAAVLGALGAAAIVHGSLLALVQVRLKMVIAYSTVAQLGYLMLVFPLASVTAWQAGVYHLISHGLAKAAMFVAAANILSSLGTDRLRRLAGLDQRLPLDVFTLALASVTLMGLPPSGGFIAKWLFLQTAWAQGSWGWVIVISAGGLLAAAYLFRILALTCFHPRSYGPGSRLRVPHGMASMAGLALAVLAIAAGFSSAPILALLESGLPPGIAP